ncbi:NAD(P)H-dependent FMN reductase [Myroides marinus]|uniref:NAD(P)H-dependent FMN reductase n=1 Tax=Myroides marinus TaxID=703342 RepID=A0A1H6WCD6_9FLAO|nr:NAD(P)H-dependent oxidoreductase [Myroides marinus]MDM1354584.1 NAD(P)H-dependent oxidoreductase [Myroides marinus]SEJ11707.1 NAD(P)H-dependent FMN reductase [Myroides marinus]
MNILAFAATNSSTSINLQLVKSVTNQLEGHNIQLLDINDYEMPIYSQDRNNTGVPQQALDFNEAIKNADAIIIGLAEHNGTFSTAFKNIFDWGSRVEKSFFQNKPMMLLSTSPGPRGGQSVMDSASSIFPYFGGNIKAQFSLPSFQDNFSNGTVTTTELAEQLKEKINIFKTELF